MEMLLARGGRALAISLLVYKMHAGYVLFSMQAVTRRKL